MQSPLCQSPQDVLETIAFHLVCSDVEGSTSLTPFLLTCRSVHQLLSKSTALYARIFKYKFDFGAASRRAFSPTGSQYYDQLVQYSVMLKVIRSGDIFNMDVDNVLFTAFIMMLENDGRNGAQLEHAGIYSFVDRFVRARLYEDRQSLNGWPADNAANACALWLLWKTTTRGKLLAESEVRRQQMIALVLPYVLIPYRYPSALAPQHHFSIPPPATSAVVANSIVTAHGPYPIYLSPSRAWSQVHYSSRPIMAPPLITIAAKLVYFSRRELVPFGIPPHLPLNRADAIARGRTDIGPTKEDIIEFNQHPDTKLPRRGDAWGADDASGEPLSKSSDDDWWRLRLCSNAWVTEPRLGRVYTPGLLTGLWQGRMLIPSENQYNALITSPEYPPTFSEGYLGVTTVPVYMRIKEHHFLSPDTPVPCSSGLANGYFPPAMQYSSSADGVTVMADGRQYEYLTQGPARVHNSDSCDWCKRREEELSRIRSIRAMEGYDALFERAGLGSAGLRASYGGDSDESEGEGEDFPEHDPAKVLECDGIQDVIFTGATDERHGQAWNHFEYYGRVRPWDGLIGILRCSRDRRLGTIFFYGYIVDGQNFVGNWRVAHQDVNSPAWEGAFSMSKRDD